ncbi:hypothetical protein ACRWQN_17710 [Shewanella sp. HL-SH8]|uniref:hypothetical protein n=1 Tax=Shewanella sp. HL-SH8 TaxID=3436242 RepID=UPI003EBF9D60
MTVIRFKAPKTCQVVPNGPLVQYADYLKLEKENAQLKSEVEELKAQLFDAIGDGFYDGYSACAAFSRKEHFDSCSITEDYIVLQTERYESHYRYTKSISDIRAKAVMDFADHARGTYLAGLVPSELTVYDLYQTARNHVKDNYNHESELWTGEDAEKAKGGAA